MTLRCFYVNLDIERKGKQMSWPKKESAEPRINVIIDGELKKKAQMRALCEGKTLTDVVTDLLIKWLKTRG